MKPLSGPKGFSFPSHTLYADDILVFCKGDKKSLEALMNLFMHYGQASGQLLSLEKCKFYYGKLSAKRVADISYVLGFLAGQLPFNYLGVPLFQGKPKKSHLQPIVDRIKVKLAAWKGKLLSIMGRVQLLKSIIHGMLIYSFHVYAWPVSLLKSIDNWIRNFIWSGDIHVKKIVTVAWHKVCCPLIEGGLGIRSLRALNKAAMLKLSWEMVSSNKQWVVIIRARYFKNKVPVTDYAKSSI